jgi:hypothetical protein
MEMTTTAAETAQIRMGEGFGIALVLCRYLYRCVVFRYPTFRPLAHVASSQQSGKIRIGPNSHCVFREFGPDFYILSNL